MEVNNIRQNGEIIYPQNLKKYTGYIEEIQSKKNRNTIVSFRVRIRSPNFKFSKCFPSRREAEEELVRQNIENKLEIKNIMFDRGDHYAVRLPNGKEFLADKVDLHFIEAHNWSSNNDYVVTHQNGKPNIRFHNLMLNHSPTFNSTVDHINRNPLDNRRKNLRIVSRQTQLINRNSRNMANQPGVNFYRKHWIASWIDKYGNTKTANFNINKLGYEAAKQLAIAKRLEIELTLNHYHLALHNLPPLELQELNLNFDFEEPDEPDKI